MDVVVRNVAETWLSDESPSPSLEIQTSANSDRGQAPRTPNRTSKKRCAVCSQNVWWLSIERKATRRSAACSNIGFTMSASSPARLDPRFSCKAIWHARLAESIAKFAALVPILDRSIPLVSGFEETHYAAVLRSETIVNNLFDGVYPEESLLVNHARRGYISNGLYCTTTNRLSLQSSFLNPMCSAIQRTRSSIRSGHRAARLKNQISEQLYQDGTLPRSRPRSVLRQCIRPDLRVQLRDRAHSKWTAAEYPLAGESLEIQLCEPHKLHC